MKSKIFSLGRGMIETEEKEMGFGNGMKRFRAQVGHLLMQTRCLRFLNVRCLVSKMRIVWTWKRSLGIKDWSLDVGWSLPFRVAPSPSQKGTTHRACFKFTQYATLPLFSWKVVCSVGNDPSFSSHPSSFVHSFLLPSLRCVFWDFISVYLFLSPQPSKTLPQSYTP